MTARGEIGYWLKTPYRDAVTTRIGPIMVSMIITLFGLAPLVFIAGEGAELYRAVGVVVLSGLLFATLMFYRRCC